MLKSMAWSLLKKTLKSWLSGRALILPAARRAEIAGKLGLTAVQVGEVNALLREYALNELEAFRP